jgi:hypothetical protein
MMRKTGIMAALFLIVALFPQSHASGGAAERPVGTAAKADIQGRQIALSLRIAEAKGKTPSRKHFRSLLRHSKRKPLREPLKWGFGFLRAR